MYCFVNVPFLFCWLREINIAAANLPNSTWVLVCKETLPFRQVTEIKSADFENSGGLDATPMIVEFENMKPSGIDNEVSA